MTLILSTQLYPSDSTEGILRKFILTINNFCWYLGFIIGPLFSVTTYCFFIRYTYTEENTLRAWCLTYPICETFNFIAYFVILRGIRKDLYDFYSDDPTWSKFIIETINSVRIHELDLNVWQSSNNTRKEDIVYDICSHAAAFRICPKF